MDSPEVAQPAAPALEFCFEIRVAIGEPHNIGHFDGGMRRMIPLLGGTFSGPAGSGIVAPGGADWQTLFDDGSADIAARYTLVADDGSAINIINRGYRHGPAEVMAALAAGAAVDPARYYFRTAPVFEAAGERYGWLARHVFVGTGVRERERVCMRCFRVR